MPVTAPRTILGSDSNNFINSSTGADWLEGKGGNDWLFGGAGDDHLEGGAGNDELDGWQGNDTMIGGTGDDIYNVDSASDVVTEYANEGIDTVKVRKSSYTLPANVENADLRYLFGVDLGHRQFGQQRLHHGHRRPVGERRHRHRHRLLRPYRPRSSVDLWT